MDEFESLSHSRWECKYHVVFIPKCRRKMLYVQLRQHLGEVFRQLAQRRESQILEGRLMPDPVPMRIAIPPKYAVSQMIGYMKGKSAFTLPGCMGSASATSWARIFERGGYFISTVGRDGQMIRRYIRDQGKEDERLDQLRLV